LRARSPDAQPAAYNAPIATALIGVRSHAMWHKACGETQVLFRPPDQFNKAVLAFLLDADPSTPATGVATMHTARV
jgi:hypothetical protein